jgi:phosphatidylserine decarboxylase
MFHKEGYLTITFFFISAVSLTIFAEYNIINQSLKTLIQLFSGLLLILILQFFRNPKRVITRDIKKILSPVDGKVVVIESVCEKEYFKDNRMQVSIFMSPLNVHITRYPLSGKVTYSKYHPGKYLFAWHPKSSEENERTTIVIKNTEFGEVLYRQVAGALARRIVNYAKVGSEVKQGDDAGFIKFGSRVDLFLPIDTPIEVVLNQIAKGAKTIISSIK